MGSERDNCVSDTHSVNTSTQTADRGHTEVRMARNVVDKNSAKYKEDRERNNRAVQKTRANKREKEVETQRKIDGLKAENQDLETGIKEMDKILSSLREIHGPMPFSS